MLKEMGIKKFYIGKPFDHPTRAKVMFQGSENVLYDIFVNPQTKTIFEDSAYFYEGTKITRWVC